MISNVASRYGCPMRHKNGNCLPCGGFCTAVNDEICGALHEAYSMGSRYYYLRDFIKKPDGVAFIDDTAANDEMQDLTPFEKILYDKENNKPLPPPKNCGKCQFGSSCGERKKPETTCEKYRPKNRRKL